MILIYTTCESKEQAQKISHALLKKKLCACVIKFPIESEYWWKGKIEKTREYALLIKTKKEKFKTIQKEIKKMHSYETPCILQLDVSEVDERYNAWLRGVIS